MKKRVLSLLLALTLCLTLLPTSAFAAEPAGTSTAPIASSESAKTAPSAPSVGGENGGNGENAVPQNGEGNEAGSPAAQENAAAQIGEQSYATLPAALNAAQDGDTVKLLANHTTDWSAVEAGEAQMAVVKKQLTLDLNGKTVDYLAVGEVVPDESGGILESTDGNLTVKSSPSGGTGTSGGITTLKLVRGALSVQDGGNIGSSAPSSSGLICEAGSGTVTISGGTVYNAAVGEGATVTVSGGSEHAGSWYNSGTLNITDGTFNGVQFCNNDGTIAISGGTFSTLRNFDASGESLIPPMYLLAQGYAFYDVYNEGTVKDGGKRDFLQDVTVKAHTHTMVDNKCACGLSCTHTDADDTSTIGADGKCTLCGTQFAAIIDETYYADVKSALDEATGGQTVKLLADGTLSGKTTDNTDLDKSLTLDLNGYMLGSNGSLTVKNGAALTVTNADGEKSEKPAKMGLYLKLLVEKGGSFTCTDGKIQYLGLQGAGTGDYSIKLAEGENHCAFGSFAQGDETATVGDLLKATPGMVLHAEDSDSDMQVARSTKINDLTYITYYVGSCSGHQIGDGGECIYCGASYVASVTTSGGETNNYTSLDDALNAAKDGDTVTLQGNAEITKTHQLWKPFTLELNGKTATVQKGAPLIIRARIVIQDSSTEKTGNMVCTDSGTHMLNVQNGDLTIKSGTFAGKIAAFAGGESKLTIEGGTFTQEVNLGTQDIVSLSGGTFTQIWHMDSFLDLLADGYAFYDKDNKLVNAAEINGSLWNASVRAHRHSFTDGACGCGYTCPHTSVNENGVCEICNKRFAASVTAGEKVTYYDTLGKALNYANQNIGCTLKLLADVTGPAVMINDPFIFDLNGRKVDELAVSTNAIIKDSGTIKGTIGALSIHNNTDPDADAPTPTIVLGDLVTGGDSLKADGKWLTVAQLLETSANDVSVAATGITGVTASIPGSVIYGQTGTDPISLTVTPADIETLTFAWFELKDNGWSKITGAGGSAYHPANLDAGSHTIRCAVISTAGYVLSDAVTVTVAKASIAEASVTLVTSNLKYNGEAQSPKVESVTMSSKTLTPGKDYYVEVAQQTNVGSYTLAVKGYGNYTGEIKDVEWKIEPIKIDHVEVSSNISKAYDGTATVTKTPEEWAQVLTFKTLSAYPVVDVPSDAYTISDVCFVTKNAAGEYVASPEVGEKNIQFTVTFKNNNYMLQTALDNQPASSKTYNQSGLADFTITQATAPTPAEITQYVYNDLAKTYTLDLAALLPELSEGCDYGEIQYRGCDYHFTDSNYLDSNNGMSVSKEGILTLPTVSAHTSNVNTQIGTITVPVVTTNYQKFEFTIKVVISARIPLNASGVTVSASDITYGQTLADSTLTATGSMICPRTKKAIPGTFAWTNPETKPGAAGDYTASWTFTPTEGYEEYATTTGTVTVTVEPAELTGVSVKASSTYYTGEAQIASIIASGQSVDSTPVTFTYSDKVDGDYTSDGPTFTDAGTYTVYYKAEAANHKTAAGTFSVQIKALPISLLSVAKISKAYDGTANVTLSANMLTFISKTAKTSNITLPDTALAFSSAQFTKKQADGSYLPSPEVGDGKALSFTMTLTSDNYVFESELEGTKTISDTFATDEASRFTITKATAPTMQPIELTVINGLAKTYLVNLPALPTLGENCTYGSIKYEACNFALVGEGGYANSTATITSNDEFQLTVPAVESQTEGSVGTVGIKITTDNYQDMLLTVKVIAKNKIVSVPDGEITATPITFGQILRVSTITGTMKDDGKTVEGTFEWTDPSTKPDKAGDYQAEWTFTPAEGYEEYATATGTVTVKVNKADPAVTAPTAKKLTYTGSEQTLLTAGITQDGTIKYRLGDSGEFVSDIPTGKDAGTYTVYFKVVGDGNHNDAAEQSITVTINPMKLSPFVLGIDSLTKVYDGTASALLDKEEITFRSNGATVLLPEDAYDITNARFTMRADGSYKDSPEAGDGKSLSFTVTLKSDNYVFGGDEESKTLDCNIVAEDAKSFTITKAATPAAETGALTITNGLHKTYSLDLSTLLPKLDSLCDYGTITYGKPVANLGEGTFVTSVNGKTGELTLEANRNGTDEGQFGTITVTISTSNYQDITLTINVSAENKIIPQADGAVTATDITYGQVLDDSKITGQMKNGSETVAGIFTWVNGTVKPDANDSYQATWKFMPSDAETYAEVTGELTIKVNKATPTGAPNYTKITTGGKTLKDAALTLDGSTLMPNAGTLEWVDDKGNALPDDTRVEANKTYKWSFTPADGNYATLTGEAELYHVSSGGSSGGTTAPVITVPVSSDKETVKVDASVSNGVATVKVTDRQLEQVATNTDTVTVDVSGLKNVDSAKLPSSIVGKAEQAGADLIVTLPTGTVTLDAAALAAVSNGKDVTISVQKATLTDAQRDAVGTLTQVAIVVDVNVLTGTAKRSNFNGGKLTVSIPYTLKAGEDPTKLQVWFIRDDGSIENKGGSYDRKTGCFVFSTEHLSRYLLVSTASAQCFVDVPVSAYYAEAVAWAVNNGITGGTSATTFAPDGFCTRAQAVTFLWRAAGSPAPKSTAMPFADVPAGSYYYDAVLWAIENGVTKGTSDTTFSPNANCSRGQIVTFLWRSQKSPDAAAANPFTDVAANAYYTSAVLWAVEKSITGGTSATTFSPSANCTRAQIVTFLHRMYQGN